MALKMNYNLSIFYTLGRLDSKENYKDKLTDEQISQLDNNIEKVFTIQDAYFKIDSLNGTKENIEIKLGIYKNEQKQVIIDNKTYNFVPSLANDSSNFIKQGYEYLKTLDEFKDAVDLLDE